MVFYTSCKVTKNFKIAKPSCQPIIGEVDTTKNNSRLRKILKRQ